MGGWVVDRRRIGMGVGVGGVEGRDWVCGGGGSSGMELK